MGWDGAGAAHSFALLGLCLGRRSISRRWVAGPAWPALHSPPRSQFVSHIELLPPQAFDSHMQDLAARLARRVVDVDDARVVAAAIKELRGAEADMDFRIGAAEEAYALLARWAGAGVHTGLRPRARALALYVPGWPDRSCGTVVISRPASLCSRALALEVSSL
jgi:hypothetical protein